MKAKYVNPFTGFGFKKIFGEEASKPLLTDFLNSLLPESNKIKELSFKNTEHLGSGETDRKSLFDIYCEAENGEKFIVELQKAKKIFLRSGLFIIRLSQNMFLLLPFPFSRGRRCRRRMRRSRPKEVNGTTI